MNVPAAADTRSRAPLEEKPPTAHARRTDAKMDAEEGRAGPQETREGREEEATARRTGKDYDDDDGETEATTTQRPLSDDDDADDE